MENAEEILQCLDEFSKLKPKDIPRELEEYLCFVAKTGDPVYQWPIIKCLFREKLLNVITDFYESCPTIEIPSCPNVDNFNYENMKNFILEKLDTFAAAPFTVQRICELLTSPRKEYNRIDKYMRALEKNILVVSTREPGNRKSTENGESIVNGLESEHVSQDVMNSDINVEVEMDETAVIWPKSDTQVTYTVGETNIILDTQVPVQDTYVSASKTDTAAVACSSTIESVITARPLNYIGFTDLIIEPSINTTTTDPETVITAPEPSTEGIFGMTAAEPILPDEIPSKPDQELIKPDETRDDNDQHHHHHPEIPPETCETNFDETQLEPELVQIEPLIKSPDDLVPDAEPIETDALVDPLAIHPVVEEEQCPEPETTELSTTTTIQQAPSNPSPEPSSITQIEPEPSDKEPEPSTSSISPINGINPPEIEQPSEEELPEITSTAELPSNSDETEVTPIITTAEAETTDIVETTTEAVPKLEPIEDAKEVTESSRPENVVVVVCEVTQTDSVIEAATPPPIEPNIIEDKPESMEVDEPEVDTTEVLQKEEVASLIIEDK